MNLQVNCGTGSPAATHCQHLAICQRHTSPFSLHAWMLSQCWAHDGWSHRPTGKEVSNQTLKEWFIFLIGRSVDGGQTMDQYVFEMVPQTFFHWSWWPSLPEYLVKSLNRFGYFLNLDCHLIVYKSVHQWRALLGHDYIFQVCFMVYVCFARNCKAVVRVWNWTMFRVTVKITQLEFGTKPNSGVNVSNYLSMSTLCLPVTW